MLLRSLFRDLVYGSVSLFNRLSRSFSRLMGQPYQLVLPFATYAPWLKDKEFMMLYRELEQDCLVDLYQCWELWTLAQQKAGSEGEFLEVGVWRGGSSVILGRAILAAGFETGLCCCDSFSGLVKTTQHDPYNHDGELGDGCAETVRRKLEDFGISNFELLVGVFPDETGPQLGNRTFSLCHIDVDTRQSALDVFDWVWPQLVPGGVVVFQDYGFHRTPGISNLVDGLRGREGLTVVHNLNGNALVFKA